MTQAFNLSQLANKVNSSGLLDASTGLTNAVPVANGGTGLSSTPANGALDIGNGTGFTRTTLTAGSNISITNGAGSISIAQSGGVSSIVAGNGIGVSGSGAITVAVAAPTFNSVGSYIWGYMSTPASTTITAGASYSAGAGSSQVRSAGLVTQDVCSVFYLTGGYAVTNNLSGTWKNMGGTSTSNAAVFNYWSLFVRVS